VVVVDDGSTDDTRNLARHRDVWLLRHAVNLGQGAALQTGIAFAIQKGAHYVATFDADGQHCSEDLSTLLSVLIDEQAEFVLGSRFLGRAEGIPAMRRAVLRFGVLFTRVASRVTLTDVHNGIRVMTRRGAERLRISMNRMEHASQIVDQIAKSGMRFVEAPVTVRYTPESLAKGQRTSAALRIGFQTLIDKLVTW
jgi:glycosyltransferase involved in cell wall biosynthesis